MPHFGRLNESHVCVKKILAYFHGGILWLNTPIPVTIDLIARITGLLNAGEDLTHYIHRMDTDKKLGKHMKDHFELQRDGYAYHIASKVV